MKTIHGIDVLGPYVRKRNTFALPVTVEGLPELIEYNGKRYIAKSEFHVTLGILKYLAAPLIEMAGIDETAALLRAEASMVRLLPEFQISFSRLTGEVRRVTREGSETIVVMTEMSGLGSFYSRLNTDLGLSLEVPPAHITIFLDETAKPLELVNSTQLENDSVKLSEEALVFLKALHGFDVESLLVEQA